MSTLMQINGALSIVKRLRTLEANERVTETVVQQMDKEGLGPLSEHVLKKLGSGLAEKTANDLSRYLFQASTEEPEYPSFQGQVIPYDRTFNYQMRYVPMTVEQLENLKQYLGRAREMEAQRCHSEMITET